MSSLKDYNKKRNFTKTKEPYGKKIKGTKSLRFVIQHHLARKDHYDLRLEHDGVYVSFAIPKGPSYNPKDKRLAVKVEDHPISYGLFEGIIPKGEYGAGTVMLWDRGYYKVISGSFNDGIIKVNFKGERIIGAWALVKFKDDNWLLIKENDETAKNKAGISQFKTSIKTGKSMAEIVKPEMFSINELNITNGDKIIFPKEKITKADVIKYYYDVKKKMMPYLENRLISVVRAPEGLDGNRFFMKHFNTDSKNLGIKKIKSDKEIYDYYYIKNYKGILEEVQMNSYEFHMWGAKVNSMNKPDIMVFDLDPDENLPISSVRKGVRELKIILDNLNLSSYLKTSGGKGYHVVVPFEFPSWKKCEDVSKNIALVLMQNSPKLFTLNIRKEKRKGKIFIDYFRNKKGATSVAPYSLRLREKASISMPISWKDLDKIKPNQITIRNYKTYLKKNPWKNFFNNK